MTQIKRWTVGLAFCLPLWASNASATYIVVENISQDAPDWGDCSLEATYLVVGLYGPVV